MVDLEFPGFSLGKINLSIYGEDQTLSRPRQHRSSLIVPGRIVNGKWSILHEIGNRKLLSTLSEDAHSFVRNFYNHMVMNAMDSDILGASTYAAGSLGMKNTGGSISAQTTPHRIGTAGVSGSGYRGPSGDASHGCQAGLGDGAGAAAAFSFDDFQLESLIAEGTGTDQMNYVAMADYTVANVVYASGTLKWTATYERFMNNNSGNSIVVEEIGLAVDSDVPSGNINFLMARDVLGGSALTIADAGQLKVTYTLSSPALPS